ncbi:hypothetical protein NDU88_001930 [Pleurodeles waltl]|uniref:Uncharacterized protein n=1 Tax=Pleurodeles waltl TaxID=8319 RepID=A0AAV7WN10_PLEWA|nr:hypothetical protein NDU88_001930 [Pleurodeles waltl]
MEGAVWPPHKEKEGCWLLCQQKRNQPGGEPTGDTRGNCNIIVVMRPRLKRMLRTTSPRSLYNFWVKEDIGENAGESKETQSKEMRSEETLSRGQQECEGLH